MIAAYAGGVSGAWTAARTGSTIVVVDAFRASTMTAVLVSKGARVVPVASIEEAASAGTDFRVGERGGAKVAGFDFGNSPTEILAAEIQPGSTVALSTTNGTRVIEAASRAPAIFTGAFVNATTAADVLAADSAGGRVTVVGCGWEGRHASEDEAAAGAILHRLRSRGAELDGRAGRVVERYLSRSARALRNNGAARRLKRLGYERDLEFCLAEDMCLSCRASSAAPSSGVLRNPGRPANLRPEGQYSEPKLVLDKGVTRHYPGVSEGGSNVTSSVESATGRR